VTDRGRLAMLLCRWALRRLGRLLGGYPTLLVDQLYKSSSRVELQKAFDAVHLPTQPAEVQHRLGVRVR
jgi:hypothetical protein